MAGTTEGKAGISQKCQWEKAGFEETGGIWSALSEVMGVTGQDSKPSSLYIYILLFMTLILTANLSS